MIFLTAHSLLQTYILNHWLNPKSHYYSFFGSKAHYSTNKSTDYLDYTVLHQKKTVTRIDDNLLCSPGIVFKLSATVDRTMNKTEIMARILAEKDELGFSSRSHIFLRRPAQHVTPRNSSPSRSAIASSSRRFSSLEISDLRGSSTVHWFEWNFYRISTVTEHKTLSCWNLTNHTKLFETALSGMLTAIF